MFFMSKARCTALRKSMLTIFLTRRCSAGGRIDLKLSFPGNCVPQKIANIQARQKL